MAGLIMPVAIVPEVPAAGKKGAAGPSGDFVAHVRRALAAGDQSGKLGVAAGPEVEPAEALERIAAINDPAEAMAAFLFLLKQVAAADTAAPGGGWQARASGESLQNLAAAAGFDDNELGSLFALFDDQGTASMSLVLDLFSRHFADLAEEGRVTLPETDLPLLNTIIERFGIGPEDISSLEDLSLGSDGKVGLEDFLAGLKEIAAGRDPAGDAEFSFWEIRGLRDLLARTGWDVKRQGEVGTPVPGGDKISLGLADLVDLLQKAVNNAAARNKVPDLPAFAESLKNLLGDSGFVVPGNGFSPVAAKSREDALNQLLQTVDLSTVKVQKVATPRVPVAGLKGDAPADTDGEKTSAAKTAGPAPSVEADGSVVFLRPVNPPARKGQGGGRGHDSQVLLNLQAPTVAENIAAAAPVVPEQPSLPVDPRQVINQLTAGIARGIAERQHHIQIRLQPPELGEIKVDLLVKHDQVAVSFIMEDSRVRDILESNMQQFRDQLAGRGFNLAGLDVSVGGGDDNPAEKWREAFAASGDRFGRELPAAGLSAIMAHLPARMSPGDQGINIMV